VPDGARILHLGNVAQNGYLNAKFQRRLGLLADVACDERDALAQPEWEEARVPSDVGALDIWPVGLSVDGWRRPDWVLPLRRVRRGRRIAYAAALRASRARIAEIQRRLALSEDDAQEAFRRVWLEAQLLGRMRPLLARYDIVQAYGGNALLPLVAAPGRPYVAFEHGTLRELPWEDSPFGRLTAMGFRHAAVTVITNPDVLESARRLGLEDLVFIPHPIDEEKYSPGESEWRTRLRREGVSLMLLAPARQDWREKGNDVLLRGAASLLREQVHAVLYVGDWGVDLERSRALALELGIADSVRWLPPVPKVELIDLYRAADVVLDQFVLGTFGGTAPEALACAKPVVMAFDPALHGWCFPEQPPIVPAATTEEVAAALSRLAAAPAERVRLGEEGRAWVVRNHNWRLVAERHSEIYERVLAASASPRES
jgi:glycosyltransferase involved in cell wall biosynthesis